MLLISYIAVFVICLVILWLASGLVIEGVDHFSKQTRVSSFATSVLVLGIITSFTEISIGINAVLTENPELFVGNLIGGSFVILLLIIPILALFNGGIELKGHLDKRRLFFFLVLITAPSFLVLDGRVTRYDAGFLILLYILFFYLFQNSERLFADIQVRALDRRAVAINLVKICIGATLIFTAGKFLVDSAEYFAMVLQIPSLLMSIVLLAIGTNIPELSIAWNSVLKRHADIAFGDYVGSAAANPLIFGFLTLIYGPFHVNTSGFDLSFIILMLGYVVFFFFARSKTKITVYEGMVLLMIYIVFLLWELSEVFLQSPTV